MTNIFRKGLEGLFSGILKTGKNFIGAPLVGLSSGAIGKELSQEALEKIGMSKGLGGLSYGASRQVGKVAGRTGKKVASGTAKTVKYGGRAAYETAREVIPELGQGMKSIWRTLTVENANEPLGRMLHPAVQTAGAVGVLGVGAMAGMGSYNSSLNRPGTELGSEIMTGAYDGLAKQKNIDSTVGLVQALNDLR